MKLLSYANVLILSLFVTLLSCEEAPKEEATEEVVVEGTQAITLKKLTDSPKFAEASLSLTSGEVADSGAFNMEFAVEGYALAEQTEPKSATPLANSGMGQHIHLIVDNSPYEAHYTNTSVSTTKLAEPGRHVILAFLSRSYHESVKNMDSPQSFVLEQRHIGEGESEEVDLSAPHMFYSRPKGTYKGADTEHLLLDFFLVNTELAADGNKVRATINGTEFFIEEWAPHVIEGLPKGKVTVQLELIDADGNAVPGPYNNVTRTVTLEE